MASLPQRYLGDVLRLWARLPDDGAARAAAARSLGFGPPALRVTRVPARTGEAAVAPQPSTPPGHEEPRPPSNAPRVDVTPTELRPIASVAEDAPAWLRSHPGIDAVMAHEASVVALEPLFPTRTVRSLIVEALATRDVSRDIDVERAVDRAARRLPLDPVPTELRATLRRGAQVLVDNGGGMLPFSEDVDELLRELARTVRTLDVAWFSGCPTRGVARGEPLDEWPRYEPPRRPGAPVLVLSDLGIGGATDAAPVGEWLDFAKGLRARRHPLVALVPYRRERWPQALARSCSMLLWDRTTTVAHARRARRAGEPR